MWNSLIVSHVQAASLYHSVRPPIHLHLQAKYTANKIGEEIRWISAAMPTNNQEKYSEIKQDILNSKFLLINSLSFDEAHFPSYPSGFSVFQLLVWAAALPACERAWVGWVLLNANLAKQQVHVGVGQPPAAISSLVPMKLKKNVNNVPIKCCVNYCRFFIFSFG